MEYINKIEAAGVVGRIRVDTINGATLASFSLYTEYAHRDRNGAVSVTSTWFQVHAQESEKNQFSGIKKGDFVGVTGRLRVQKYTNSEGGEASLPEIVANSVTLIMSAEE